MLPIKIDPSISSVVPTFKLGLISYHSIVISDSPQMLKGRLQFFQETLQMELAEKELTDFAGVAEWRAVFKQLNIDPSKYRPSHEALLRRIKQNKLISSIQSAVDLNTFFSLQYQIPMGLYDSEKITGDIVVRLGHQGEEYQGINGRVNNMTGKIISSDQQGAFGSLIVDSIKTSVTKETAKATHLIYIKPSMSTDEAQQLVDSVAKMFTQIHGGDVIEATIIEAK
ncbi:B3/B4 domain-containing protein [Bacillus sp. FJAT-45037]|uniref:B3/B4 domain-containing protein n=1 Tax=Bacillus sp. FJAT-45037 TaxID=2011007 RepID=UPI000C244AC2|nr:phenylalanine--tRNA ligase beta subunit-related protein [Bacillus sp. FJAT-45037]